MILRLFAWLLVAALALSFSRPRPTASEPTRWFIPGAPGLEAGRTPQAHRGSAFGTRALGLLNRPYEQAWGEHNGVTPSLSFSHNLAAVFPASLYREHPEFFPVVGGRRFQPPNNDAASWNPDIARPDAAVQAAHVADAYFNEHPAELTFSLGMNDSYLWGDSDELRALVTPIHWFRERPDFSPLVFTFMNRAAAELKKKHPDKYLGALAYYWAEQVPSFPLSPQIIPFLTADRSQGYDLQFKQEDFQLMDEWGRLAGQHATVTGGDPPRRLGLYDYLYGHDFIVPRVYPRLLAENLRRARRAGFTDYFAEMGPNWGLEGPMPWLTAQLLLDPEQDASALLDEYYRRYFNEAGEPMRRFFERCEEQWMHQPGKAYWLKHFRNESQATLFPSPVCRELRGLLDEAKRRAARGVVRERVMLVSDAFGVTERFVVFKEARDALMHRVLEKDIDENALVADLSLYLERRAEFIACTRRVLRDQPLGIAPFNWDDFLKNDPVPLVLLTLQQMHPPAAMVRTMAGDAESGPVWRKISAVSHGVPIVNGGVELLRNPRFDGPLLPACTMAGLEYGIASPAEWCSHVEPAQFHEATIVGSGEDRALRIKGAKDSEVLQWVACPAAELQLAEMVVRGRVSPSCAVYLSFAWMDAQQRHLEIKRVRLPDGEWPDWVTLRHLGTPPSGAAWVGIGLRIQNQLPGDWVEVHRFSLRNFE